MVIYSVFMLSFHARKPFKNLHIHTHKCVRLKAASTKWEHIITFNIMGYLCCTIRYALYSRKFDILDAYKYCISKGKV